MVRLSGRLAVYVASLFVLIGVYAVAYQWGMATYEGESRTWYGAFEIVVQSMTTTGYGQDAPWESLEMTALMVLIQITGIAYIFVAFPLFVVPWLERLVEPTPPERIDDVADHVVIVGYTDLCASIVEELESRETPYVVVEADRDRAQDLHEDGLSVLHGDAANEETVDAAQVDGALAVVVDASEREFVGAILTIDDRAPEVTILAMLEDPERARYVRYAGADEVLSPRHRLGKALGDKVRDVLTLAVEDAVSLEDHIRIAEYPIDADSDFAGEALSATRRLERAGVTVLGAWVRGDFLTTLPDDVHADENTALLVAGTDTQLESLEAAVGSSGRTYDPTPGRVLVVASGTVGATAVGGLERADVETCLVASDDGDFVDLEIDVVGDPTAEETFREASVDGVDTVLIALEDDEDAILATLVASALAPEVELLAAAQTSDAVGKLRTAGADYVLALPSVAGRMVALSVFEDEVMTLGERLQLVCVDTPALVGSRLEPATLRERTGCAVVALERDGAFETDVDGVCLERGDRLLLAGTERALNHVRERYGGT
ncbi:potassium channel family protein [Natronobiforma cellulositropha]|uniref:potassium channel family protein n=1 Tax=Natronobiforma cellulositropha TaxID=1679076 RepID=UPI0021D5EB02|nr:NAD-binding protein [Natronobiforma cellulositropha]